MNQHLAEEVIAQVLRELKLGTDPLTKGLWPVFTGSRGTDPDEIIMVTNNSIESNGRIQATGETQGLEGVQIRVRSLKQKSASARVIKIANAFDSLLRLQLTVEDKSYLVQAVHRLGTPIAMGPDPNNRVSFALNCVASISEE